MGNGTYKPVGAVFIRDQSGVWSWAMFGARDRMTLKLHCTARLGRRWIAASAAVGATLLVVIGCSSNKPANPYAYNANSPIPTVVSGDSARDAAAYRAGQQHLGAANFHNIKEKGPKPMLGDP